MCVKKIELLSSLIHSLSLCQPFKKRGLMSQPGVLYQDHYRIKFHSHIVWSHHPNLSILLEISVFFSLLFSSLISSFLITSCLPLSFCFFSFYLNRLSSVVVHRFDFANSSSYPQTFLRSSVKSFSLFHLLTSVKLLYIYLISFLLLCFGFILWLRPSNSTALFILQFWLSTSFWNLSLWIENLKSTLSIFNS